MARTSKRESPDEPAEANGNASDPQEKEATAGDADSECGDDAIPAEEETPAEESDIDPPASMQDELASERDKYLRLAAEYDNYRKRSSKELKNMYSDARADTITKLLPVYDNLERALKMECADDAFYKGVEMTMTQLTEILEGMGVVMIHAVGEQFDPNRHNAVMAIENPELGEKTVAEEFQKGFMLGEKVLRFSTVIVAN
ncbi:MAG: nucleotide exchange factor GrpE [Oscillospiraceae bacterium]|nr:nucleotide exchange factor GrpE [Oscillospiraceae bacterium]